jgi:hypothetical protein
MINGEATDCVIKTCVAVDISSQVVVVVVVVVVSFTLLPLYPH